MGPGGPRGDCGRGDGLREYQHHPALPKSAPDDSCDLDSREVP